MAKDNTDDKPKAPKVASKATSKPVSKPEATKVAGVAATRKATAAKALKTSNAPKAATAAPKNNAEPSPVATSGLNGAFGSPFAMPQPHEEPKPQRKRYLMAALLLLASTSAGFLGGWLGAGRSANGDTLVRSSQQRSFNEQSELISSIAAEVGPSVVSVDVTGETQSQDLFGFGGGGTTQSRSAGTGIILTANGLVVTNRHVVPQGTTKVSLTLADGTELNEVEVVGRSQESNPLDVAFLKIQDTKGKKLTPAKIGDSSKTNVGDRVVAIGNALGQFQNTVTSGIISGYGRNLQAGGGPSGGDLESLQDLFQTDAAINQGNSGGPLVNSAGEVIGINTAVAGGSAQGIGFAIPMNNINGLIKSVIETGELKQPYLGVRYIALTDGLAQQFKLKVKRGAYILPADQTGQPAVYPDSPAEKAGLRGGDVITEVNGTKVNEQNSLAVLLSRNAVGDTVDLRVVRDGKTQSIKAKLEAAPNPPRQ